METISAIPKKIVLYHVHSVLHLEFTDYVVDQNLGKFNLVVVELQNKASQEDSQNLGES